MRFYICLSVILIDSVFKMGKIYHPQVILEECKYIVNEKVTSRFISDDLEIYLVKSFEDASDESVKSDDYDGETEKDTDKE